MKISELFYSIQGEGKRTGYPSFFIRTNFCNLRCKFSGGNLCDTAHTSWFPDDRGNIGVMNIPGILESYKKYNSDDIVITGGEPAMQADELYDLCLQLKKLNNNAFITLETNGTIYGKFSELINLISISPKLKSSVPYSSEYEEMHNNNRINLDSFRKFQKNFSGGDSDIQWKFVITGETDIGEIIELKNSVGFENRDIFLMPEGITGDQLNQKREMVIELCKKYQMNYSDRLQILLWDNRRGT